MDRKRRKQAEFLIHHSVPWSLIQGIGVIDATTQQEVQKNLENNVHIPPITIDLSWYYS
jgi:hypothetical protein